MAESTSHHELRIGRPGVNGISVGDTSMRIAVPVAAFTKSEIVQQWQAAVDSDADIIEWRVDGLVDPELETLGLTLRDIHRIPVLVTLRTKREGGRFPLREGSGEYRRLLRQAAHWADAVDIEAAIPDAPELIVEARELGSIVVVSQHVFDEAVTADRLRECVKAMAAMGADIVKIAWMVNNDDEATVIEEAQVWANDALPIPTVIVGMGEAGVRTRVGQPGTRNAFTFAHAGTSTAPGQPSVDEVRQSLTV